LIAATARALARTDSASVGDVVAIAGTGRNTFYEFFDDVPHARKAVEQAALKLVEDALRAAETSTRTPVERFRALARAWFDTAAASPAELELVLRSPGASGLSAAGTLFAAALARAVDTLRASGVVPPEREPLRARAVAASAESFARSFTRPILAEAERSGTAADRARLERVLVDVAVRLLR
jgi:AcrR family transcriptional regulator